MGRRLSLLALLIGLLVLPSAVHAQYRRGRNAPAMTPYGPVYNPTQTPEWRQAGGNYQVWQQIMMQKMAAQEQAAFQKELAQYQKMLKAQGQNPPLGVTNTPMPVRRVKKKHVSKPAPTAKAKEATKDDKTSTAKPITDAVEDTSPVPATSQPEKPSTTTKPADASK